MAWELILDEKKNQNYRGKAEWCNWELTVALPDQMGSSWTAQQALNAHIEELQKQDAIILEYRMWEDASPTFETHYYFEVVSSASPIWWTPIIVGVLAILAIVATYFAIKATGDIVEYIGEAAPVAIPLLAIGAIAALTVLGIALVRRQRT
jgi:hypothetical protein